MIDLCQWRASIGLWDCCKWSCCNARSTVKEGCVLGRSREKNKPTISLIVLFLSSVLLILAGDVELNPGPVTGMITKVLLKVLDECYDSLSLALHFCLEDVAKDMFSKGLISESTMTTPNYDAVISEFKTGMQEKKDTPQLERHCRLFLTCLSIQGGPAEAVADYLAEQWKEEVSEKNVSFSLDVVLLDEDVKQMESESLALVTNTEIIEHVSTDETEYLESHDIYDHFNDLLRQFKDELHKKLAKGEEQLSNITDFVQQLVSTEDLCDVKDLDEVLMKLDCYYNFLDCQLIILFAKRFAAPAILQKFENHSREAKMFCRFHTIEKLQNYFNFDTHQTNASISLNVAWVSVIIDRLYMLIEQFSVKHESHFVLQCVRVTESSVHIMYFMRDSSTEIQEIIALAQKKVSFMCFTGIYEFTINGHTILLVDNEENFRFGSALLNAAKTGHNEAVRFLLNLADHCNEEGTTAIMLASEGGHEPVVQSLLAVANINSQDNDGWTALMKASKNNHSTIVHTLLEAGAEPHLQNSKGGNALMIASGYGHHEVVEQLLKENSYQQWKNGKTGLSNAQADPNMKSNDGLTALMIACSKGHFKVVELLLNNKADPNIQNSDGCTALMFATHTKIVELLLNEKADPNIQDSNGLTALMMACSGGHVKVVELLLLIESTDPNVQAYNGWTALMLAIIKGYNKIVELLLNKGADPNKANMQGMTTFVFANHYCYFSMGTTALMLASHSGYSSIVELLLKEADPNIQDMDGKTALRFANQKGNFEVVELLLKQHANPNIRDHAGWTELHCAVLGSSKRNNEYGFMFALLTGTFEDYIKIIQLLIGHCGIDIDAVTGKGVTSLMLASIHGSTQVVELLLDAGANPNIQMKTCTLMKDIMSDLPGDIQLQPQAKPLLLRNYSVYKESSPYGRTALMSASMHGHLVIVQMLLHAKAKPDLQDETGFTALLFAVGKGYCDIVQQLLECGTNPNISNRDGMTPLFLAVYCLSVQHSRKLKPSHPVISMQCEMVVGSYEDCLKILSLLIAQPNLDITLNARYCGYTCLHFASIYGCKDAVELLLQANANPDVQTHGVDTLNDLACFSSDILLQPQFKQFLLSDYQTTMSDGWSALMFACVYGHSEIFRLLLHAKPKCDLQTVNGDTVLNIAALSGCPDIVQQLLEYGANPNITNKDGITPVYAAVYFSSSQHIRKLENDPVISLASEMVAGSYNDYLKILQLLIVQPDVDILLNAHCRGYTSLHLASYYGCTDAVELLLQANANPNIQTHGVEIAILSSTPSNLLLQPKLLPCDFQQTMMPVGLTALMFACANGYSDIVQLLLNANAKPDLQDENGDTALNIAVTSGHPYIVQLLLEYGADPNISNMQGVTAIHASFSYLTGMAMANSTFATMEVVNSLTTVSCGTYEHHLKTIKLLSSHPNIKINEAVNKVTVLMIASYLGIVEVVALLLQAGADPNISTMDKPFLAIHRTLFSIESSESIGCTALMFACEKGHLEVVQLLLKAKAKPNHQSEDAGVTALIIAVKECFTDIVQQLLEYGADPNISDANGFTAIHYAVRPNDVQSNPLHEDKEKKLEIIQLLIERGVNINIKSIAGPGMTPLMMACKDSCNNSVWVIELLLKSGADPNIQTEYSESKSPGLSALMFACQSGNLENTKLLLKAKANPNQKQINGITVLMIAALQGYPDIAQQLLEYGADLNIRDKIGCTAIHYVAMLHDTATSQSREKMMSGKLEILQLLIARGINVNIKDGNGMTALMLSSIVGFTEVVKLLLQAGADPNIEKPRSVDEVFVTSSLPETHKFGFTALIYACLEINSEVTELLLRAKANPNQENALALMFAAQKGYLDIVQQLLNYGADPNSISNIDGSTAIHCALQSQTETLHEDKYIKENIKLAIIQQLIEKGANVNIQNEDGLTALMIAAAKDLLEVIELLLQNGADTNVCNNKGRTALMYACRRGNSEVAESLLMFNANPLLVDENGFTASLYALHSGNKGLACKIVNDRNFSQNELKLLLIMDLLEGDLTEAVQRVDEITDLTIDKKELIISCIVGCLEDVIGKLHESGLDPDTPLVGGLTLLMIASSCGHIELVEYLIIVGSNVNRRDIFWKYTPLFYAISGSKMNELVELLLENGADINSVAGNQTPLDMANSSPVKDLLSSMLLKNGGQKFSELTSKNSEINLVDMPLQMKKKSPTVFADFSDQVKSLIQDTVVKREQTEYNHT